MAVSMVSVCGLVPPRFKGHNRGVPHLLDSGALIRDVMPQARPAVRVDQGCKEDEVGASVEKLERNNKRQSEGE